MELLVDLGHWANFLRIKLAIADVEHDIAKESLSIAEAEGLIQNWSGDRESSVTVSKARRDLEPDVREARDELFERYTKVKLLKAVFESVEADRFTVSRELTRRVGGADVERRVDRWTT